MPILALETSTDSLSVALSGGADCPAEGWVHQAAGGPEASRILIPAVLDLLERSGQRLQDLQAIAFGAGPGSFTGLRTACAVTGSRWRSASKAASTPEAFTSWLAPRRDG